MGILKLFREANEAVRKGNEYRLQKYGPKETFKESWEKAQEHRKRYKENNIPKCLSMFATKEELQAQDSFKMKFEYWDEWTGGRFARRKNPYIDMTKEELMRNGVKKVPDYEKGSVCRSNPVTGYWESV